MDQHPEFVNEWQTQNDHYVVDIDTPKDLDIISAQKSWTFSLPNFNSL